MNNSEDRIYNENLVDYSWKDEDGIEILNENLNEYFQQQSIQNFNEAIQKYMPIGSVVKLKNIIGSYMLIGFKKNINNVEFDYLAIKYPEGVTENPKQIVFNHEQIEKIHHVGMMDGVGKQYKKRLLGEDEGFNNDLVIKL